MGRDKGERLATAVGGLTDYGWPERTDGKYFTIRARVWADIKAVQPNPLGQSDIALEVDKQIKALESERDETTRLYNELVDDGLVAKYAELTERVAYLERVKGTGEKRVAELMKANNVIIDDLMAEKIKHNKHVAHLRKRATEREDTIEDLLEDVDRLQRSNDELKGGN